MNVKNKVQSQDSGCGILPLPKRLEAVSTIPEDLMELEQKLSEKAEYASPGQVEPKAPYSEADQAFLAALGISDK